MTWIPINKRGKKARKAYYAAQRSDWNGMNPCQRVFPDRKKFSKAQRVRDKAAIRRGLSAPLDN